jgi:hypothetical protein
MTYKLEYVTELTVLLRHPNMAKTIRRFFAEAGKNPVRAFYNETRGFGGYVFYVPNPKNSSREEDSGSFHKLVTTWPPLTFVKRPGEEAKQIRPSAAETERIKRQFTHNEWFSGTFRGRLDRVAPVGIEDAIGRAEL